MKRLPIYGLLIAGYIVIIIGLFNLMHDVSYETPMQTIPSETVMPIIPTMIVSGFILIITVSIGVYLIAELWKYLLAHKTLLPLPFLLIGIGFLQLAINLMNWVKQMIESNAQVFVDNLTLYTSSFQSLVLYTVIGIVLIGASVGYSFYLKFTS